MAKKGTAANTAPVITRSGNTFTATWAIQTKATVSEQIFRYRTYNGTSWSNWYSYPLSVDSTSAIIQPGVASTVTVIEAQTRIQGPKATYNPSAWASYIYAVSPPPTPTLSVSKDSANTTTFSWTSNASDTDSQWYRVSYYRTKCTTTPDSDSDWSAWAPAGYSSYTYTDNVQGQTRVFQIKSVGPGGESATASGRHAITTAPAATWRSTPVSYTTMSSFYQMTYGVNISGSTDTVDSIVPQYYIGKPAADMSCPGGASFTDGATYNYSNGKTSYALAINTADLVDLDECLWARVKTTHDGIESLSSAYRVITGRLIAPTCSISVSTITAMGFTVTVNVTDAGTSVPGAYQQVYLEKRSMPGEANYILLGTIPNGTSSKAIASTLNITGETGYGIHVRNVTADGVSMTSAFYDYETTMPITPVLNSVTRTNAAGKVYLVWTNRWAAATGATIAWTDDRDNWMSNDEPETFTVPELTGSWYITGLQTGKTWYFRVRSIRQDGDDVTYSGWSNEVEIDLSLAPATPVLYLSDETITEDDMVTAYWSYVTSDGTAQVSGNVVIATLSNGAWVYGRSVGATTTAQHVDIYAKEQGWTNGMRVYLALQTRSGSGGQSEYSTPRQLEIAARPTVSITSTSLVSSETLTEYFVGDGSNKVFECGYTLSSAPTVKVNGSSRAATYSGSTVTLSTAPADGANVSITYTTEDNKILDEMPFTATIAAEHTAELTLAIERDVTYPMMRPDGTETDGAAGETIYVATISANASNSFSIGVDDLVGKLDDGAFYNLVATVSDKYGQTTEAKQRFKVHWSHQAWEPTVAFQTDEATYSVKITPSKTADYAAGDTCDIYRLGVDKPELIYSGAEFDTAYVDPYPAFGPNSGYKVVTITANKDYITEARTFAEFNTTEGDGTYTQLDPGLLVIDFGNDRIELPYNISLDNSWAKDFQRTVYLGGHVTGDYNRAVTRDLSAGTVTARKLDNDTIVTLRRLAKYVGICHVRTPEGSSFAADVQVSEQMSADSALGEYNLTIQKIDTIGFDAMTEAEWNEFQ